MAYVKKNLSPEQRHANAVRAANAVRNHNGGRRKGVPNANTDPANAGVKVRTMRVRDPDYQIIRTIAEAARLTVVDFMHSVAKRLKELNPKVFEPTEVTVFRG